MADDGDGGGCATETECIEQQQQIAIQQYQEYQRRCEAGDANYCTGYQNGMSRPITGIHYGTSVTMDVFYGGYAYNQTDYLFDWKSGTIYKTETTGSGTYVGALNGAALEGYVGTSNVHGIPLSATPDQVNGLLGGSNFDFAVDVGGDLLPDIEASIGKGVSVDLDPDTGTPQITSAGLMYTSESKVGLGISAFPFPVDGGFQGGYSQTTSMIFYQIPWWPFQ